MAITLTTSWQQIASYSYIPGTGFKSTFRLDARYTTQSIADNKTHIEVRLRSTVEAGSGSGYNYGFGASYCGTVSGSTRWTIENETITSGSGDVAHNADGSKTITLSGWGYINGLSLSFEISADCILPKIPRYATCTQSSTGKTETSINMKWTSDSTCDYVWYSTNNGSSWTAIGSVNASSGTYSIPNLTANTSYNIKTRIRRKDSQLTTDSTALNISTYDYPKVSTAPSFLIGNNPTIGIYNPLGRSCKIYLIGNDNNQKEIGTITTESISGINTAAWKTWLYNSIPNTKSGTYRIRIVVSALSRDNTFTGNSYSIRDDGSELPNFSESDWSYIANLTSLTNNNQAVINGNSQITFTVNTQATSSFGATITGYIYKWGTKSSTNGSVSSGEGSILEVDAVDSRGLIKPTTKTLVSGSTYIPYTKPTLDYSGSYTHRTDGISTEVRITLRGNLSVVKFGESGINNTVSDCKYRVYNYSTNTWSGPYDIPANNFTLNENGVYRLSNYLIHANGSSGGFTTGIRYGIEIILKDGNGLLSTLTTSLIAITDGKIAKDVFQDGNGNYHQGINGLADEDYTEIIHGNEKIEGEITASKADPTLLKLERNNNTGAAGIQFLNTNGLLGFLGMTGSADSTLKRWKSDMSTNYEIIDRSMVKTASSKTHTNYNNNQNFVPAMSFLSFWNGAYNSNNISNLTYCHEGIILGKNAKTIADGGNGWKKVDLGFCRFYWKYFNYKYSYSGNGWGWVNFGSGINSLPTGVTPNTGKMVLVGSASCDDTAISQEVRWTGGSTFGVSWRNKYSGAVNNVYSYCNIMLVEFI